jgi:hypothetical protein
MRPTRPSESRSRETASRKIVEGEARILLDVPATLHHALKLRALERRMTVKAYILELLEADGICP